MREEAEIKRMRELKRLVASENDNIAIMKKKKRNLDRDSMIKAH